MCGILGLVCRAAGLASTSDVVRATDIVRHRGPDDEGYVLWKPYSGPSVFAGKETDRESRNTHRLLDLPEAGDWRVALGHRRLSIVDLSPNAHQPMVHDATGVTVCYNGEVYNHIELRRELEALGHTFRSRSDTEVLLHAWLEWGPECLNRFNGMFAFLLLDPREPATLHAVRDRFGVKPLYYARVGEYLAFASEIKQIRSIPGYVRQLDEAIAADYLAYGRVDHTARTFDSAIDEIRGGERACVALDDPTSPVRLLRWYNLEPRSYQGTTSDAAVELRGLLQDSVQLRLRSDVAVGSCLSGGLDSSAIVCLAHRALAKGASSRSQITVTACYDETRFDEWPFAEQVVRQANAQAVRVWPTVERLQQELDALLWHLDDPTGSTSQFSQWCVFGAAAKSGLKVMLDGQGSDEQLAGYAGSDAAFYAGLMRRRALSTLFGELMSYRRRHHALPIAQLVLAARNAAPGIDALLPARLRVTSPQPSWLRGAVSSQSVGEDRDLSQLLRRQLLHTSLPSLLRYEDRTSMAWSVESRVPFLDYRVVEFLTGLPDEAKLRHGITKLVFRLAMKSVLPDAVRQRKDKMGFVTPEETWLRRSATKWFREGLDHAIDVAPRLLDGEKVRMLFDSLVDGSTPFTFEAWRILCFGRWLTATEKPSMSQPLLAASA